MRIFSGIILMGLTLVVNAPSQGTFSFSNTSDTLVRIDNGWSGAPTNTFPVRVEILWAPDNVADREDFNPVPGGPVALLVAGRFSGGVRTIPAGTGFLGIAPGDLVSAWIRGWTGSAETWDEYVNSGWNGYVGYSDIFTIHTGDPTTVPPGTPTAITSSTSTPFTGMTLYWPAPEPSASLLFAAGAALKLALGARKFQVTHE